MTGFSAQSIFEGELPYDPLPQEFFFADTACIEHEDLIFGEGFDFDFPNSNIEQNFENFLRILGHV